MSTATQTQPAEFRRIDNRKQTLDALRDARSAYQSGDEYQFMDAARRLAELQAERIANSINTMEATQI